MATATFAAGCFWGVEKAFRQVDGVTATAVGYTGGTTADPSYEQVCGGRTGHAEAVQVEYDPARVAYDDLLDLFEEGCFDIDELVRIQNQYATVPLRTAYEQGPPDVRVAALRKLYGLRKAEVED